MNTLKFSSVWLVLAVLAHGQQAINVPTLTSATTMTANAISMGLTVTDRHREGILVPIQNASSTALQILGVQATGDLFIEDAPRSIAANGSANITVLYYSTGGTSGGTDVIRVLTSSGLVIIPMNHGRPPVVTTNASSLSWAIGEAAVKSFTISVAGGATTPKAARALGSGNKATIINLQNGSFRVEVEPASTAQASRFPVIVDFDPDLPDVSVAVACTVGLASGN